MSKITKVGLPEYENHITEAKETLQKKIILENKLEVLKLKTKLVQEQLDILELNLGQYHRPKISPHN